MTAQPRPPALTMACLFIGVSSAMLLVELFGTLSNWGSLELREQMVEALKATPIPGIDVDEALRWLQIAFYVAVPMTVAGIVLAIYTVRRDRSARIGLTALCALACVAFLGAGVLGLLPAMLAAACAAILWSPESRNWFDGREMVRDGHAVEELTGHAPAPAPTPAAPADNVVPGAMPREMLTAGIMAMSGSLVAGAVLLSNAAAVGLRRLSPAEFERTFGDTELLAESLFGVTSTPTSDAVVIAVSLGLCLMAAAGFVLAIVLMTGRARARRPLLVLSYLAIPLTALAFPQAIVLTIMATFTAMLLNRPAARRWR